MCEEYKQELVSVKFQKTYLPSDSLSGLEISDWYVEGVLRGLQKHYELDVMDCNIRRNYLISCVSIRCHEKDRSNIVKEFCSALNNKITNVKIEIQNLKKETRCV